MANTLCVLLCFCFVLQTVFCQFGFFQPRENQNALNIFGQGLFQAPNKIREGIQGIFRPNRQRPVNNQGNTQGNVYVTEPYVPVNMNGPNTLGPPSTIYFDENAGNMNFQRPMQVNNGFLPNEGNNGVNLNDNQQNYNNGNTQQFDQNNGNSQQFDQNNGNSQQFDQNNANSQQFDQNNGNTQQFDQNNGNRQQFDQNNGNTQPFDQNNGNNQQNYQNNGQNGRQQNGGQDAPTNDPVIFESTPMESTTLPQLTPVPKVETENRNNFNFGSSPIFSDTCKTADQGVGNCISLYDCPQYLKLIQESRTQAMGVLRQAHCGFEGNNPKVCCPLPGFSTAPPEPPTTVSTTTTTTTTTAAPLPPSPLPKTAGDFIDSLPEPPVCGVSNATFSRVVGGVDAKLGDFPWMALLGYKSRRGGTSWLCGGSLISSRHILTAAHCIHNHENDLYVIRLGELDLAREDEGATPVDVLIKEKIKHEQYSATSYTNDIGILVLDKDVQFSDLIRPICMPRNSDLRAKSFEDFNPLIAGWGHTEFRGASATHLQVLQLPVVSNDFCAQAYKPYKAQTIDQRVLCAGFKKGGKDACQGDSGGPLMQPIWSSVTYKTFFYQIGVVSYGKKCAEVGFPGVYSRVTHFIPWIEEKVLGHSSR